MGVVYIPVLQNHHELNTQSERQPRYFTFICYHTIDSIKFLPIVKLFLIYFAIRLKTLMFLFT